MEISAVIDDTVGVEEYAAIVGKTDRTIRTWLIAGDIPGAERNARGVWRIPRDARRRPTGLATTAPAGAPATGPRRPDAHSVRAILDAAPGFVSVALAARLLGISEYAVREHAPRLDGVYWGENGSLVIPQSAIRRVFGITA